eukprot:scaffold40091_cov54-Attheya_sp.AAC.5
MACVAWHTHIPHAYAPHMTGDVQTRHCDAASPLSSVIWYLVKRLTQYASWHMTLSVEVTENNRQMHRDRMQESPFFRDDGGKAGGAER